MSRFCKVLKNSIPEEYEECLENHQGKIKHMKVTFVKGILHKK